MSAKRGVASPQMDLFLPLLADIDLRDQMDMMERPFFSLSKSRRMTPINYRSPDGKYFIEVLPHQNFGMATIYDLDIMIWAAAQLNMQKNRGIQNPARTLHTRTYDLLRAIGRPAGGDHVKAVMAGM